MTIKNKDVVIVAHGTYLKHICPKGVLLSGMYRTKGYFTIGKILSKMETRVWKVYNEGERSFSSDVSSHDEDHIFNLEYFNKSVLIKLANSADITVDPKMIKSNLIKCIKKQVNALYKTEYNKWIEESRNRFKSILGHVSQIHMRELLVTAYDMLSESQKRKLEDKLISQDIIGYKNMFAMTSALCRLEE